MNDFSLAMSEWETFYLLAGTAAATLMGLLFVAVSINVEAFRREAYADLQQFAGLTFNCFFYVLFISIMFLIPNVSPFGLGVPLLLLGVLGVANAIIQRRRALQQQQNHGVKRIDRRFTVPTICLAALAVISVLLMARITAGTYFLVGIIVTLLGTAAVNAYTLLIAVDVVESEG